MTDTFISEPIMITVSKFLTYEIAEKIAAAQWHRPDWAEQVRKTAFLFMSETDCFNIIAQNSGEVVGRLQCIRNDTDPKLWYYGDLFVIPGYRRRHIAENMLKTAADTLADKGCKTLRCYAEPDNIPSLTLQRKLGFAEKPHKPFNALINDGEIMFEKELTVYKAFKARPDEARYITMLYLDNMQALHGNKIGCDEWIKLLSENDPDEVHFLIYRNAIPVAWLKINGLSDGKASWISMLSVMPSQQRCGAGTYAVEFAENYCRDLGKEILYIHTTEDNIPAQRLYEKCGYTVSERFVYKTGDGVNRSGFTFSKNLK